MTYTTIAQADPWQPYEPAAKKKPKPGVPEAADFGLILVGFALLLLVGRRFLRRQVFGK